MQSQSPSTLQEAAELLAKRAVLMREVRQLQKRAFGFDMGQIKDQLGSLGGQAMDQIKSHPQIAGTLLGAGGGALLGGLSSLGKDPEERQTGNSMLTGALGGAGLGLGASYLAPYFAGQRGGMMPGLDPDQQSKLDKLNEQGNKLQEQHNQSAPTVAGTFAKDSPALVGAGAADVAYNVNRRAPQVRDIIAGASGKDAVGREPLRNRIRQDLPKLGPEEQQNVLRYAQGKDGTGYVDQALEWLRNREIGGHKPVEGLIGPHGDPAASIPAGFRNGRGANAAVQNELRTLAEQGRTARMEKNEIGNVMSAKGLGYRGLGYIGLPLLHHYLLRKTMHDMQGPMG